MLSVLVPVFNEEESVGVLLRRVLAAPLPAGLVSEVVVVDDGSTDTSAEAVEEVAREWPGRVRLIRHERNRGKGAAIRTAIDHARGDFAIIQDSDLEYDPAEYQRLLAPLAGGRCDVVFGSRFLVSAERRVLLFWHALANKILTTAANMLADTNYTDVMTGFKAFRLSLVRSILLRSDGFAIEPELAIKFAQRRASIIEVPVSYYGRTYLEGKKIGTRDALRAFLAVFRFGLTRDIYKDEGAAILDTMAHTPRFNAWMASVVRPFLGSRVMEMGCGMGNMTRLLRQGRRRYIATDIDDEHLSRLGTSLGFHPNLRMFRCDLENPQDFVRLGEMVDSVVCLNVLEHVKDDMAGLRNIFGALEPGGRAIILVPQGMSVYGTLDEALGHWRRYSEEELRSKMEQTGFRVERILRFNRVTRPGWFLNGRILRRRGFSRVQLWFFDRLVWLWKRLDSLLPWNPVSIIAIGVKPVVKPEAPL